MNEKMEDRAKGTVQRTCQKRWDDTGNELSKRMTNRKTCHGQEWLNVDPIHIKKWVKGSTLEGLRVLPCRVPLVIDLKN